MEEICDDESTKEMQSVTSEYTFEIPCVYKEIKDPVASPDLKASEDPSDDEEKPASDNEENPAASEKPLKSKPTAKKKKVMSVVPTGPSETIRLSTKCIKARLVVT